ncbi:MAG: 16S rRNA (cytosine(1402)-N(4))-methyltransferase RsmH [Gammaproteobacteria bacterium]
MFDHQPVLMNEVLGGLALVGGGCYVDATYGRGGHSAEILGKLGEKGRLLALDKDPDAVEHAACHFAGDLRFSIRHAGFESFRAYVQPWLKGQPLGGVLLDLGVSSPQLENPARGFSFSLEGPLDMRMNPTEGITAAEWLSRVDEDSLTRVLRRFGEEPRARQIARAILDKRSHEPICTTGQLARLMENLRRAGPQRIHPATRVFQALRIQVNDELQALESALKQCLELLGAGGRLCVISFHSLEDRIVKRFMSRQARGNPVYAGLPDIPTDARPSLKLIGRLIRPSGEEVAANPRARSARLRIAERLPAEDP